MKVYLGNFKSHISTIAFETWIVKNLHISENMADKIGGIIQPIFNFCWNRRQPEPIKYIKIDNFDAWNANNTMALIIYPLLVELRKQLHGAPHTEYVDAPSEFTPKEEPKELGDVDEFHFTRWEWILDEMIWAFKTYNEDWESKFHTGVSDIHFVPCADNPNLSEMKRGPKDTHKFDKDGYSACQDKIQNGFRLFGKYYMNLWD